MEQWCWFSRSCSWRPSGRSCSTDRLTSVRGDLHLPCGSGRLPPRRGRRGGVAWALRQRAVIIELSPVGFVWPKCPRRRGPSISVHHRSHGSPRQGAPLGAIHDCEKRDGCAARGCISLAQRRLQDVPVAHRTRTKLAGPLQHRSLHLSNNTSHSRGAFAPRFVNLARSDEGWAERRQAPGCSGIRLVRISRSANGTFSGDALR
jgi:hypothetical protein